MTRKQIISLILLGASIVYDIIPVDLIPDIPVLGYLDDMLVTSSAAVNCIQQFTTEDNPLLQKILKWLKWTFLLLAVLAVLVVALLISTIITLLK